MGNACLAKKKVHNKFSSTTGSAKISKSKLLKNNQDAMIDFGPMQFTNRNLDVVAFLAGNTTKRSLVIDDAATNRYVLRSYLERKNVNVVDEAENGSDALNIFQKHGNINYYDVIWVDIKMPVMDGYEFTKKVRELGFKKLIIGVTGNIQKDYKKNCFAAGMNDIIAKPIIKEIFYTHNLFKYYDDLEK